MWGTCSAPGSLPYATGANGCTTMWSSCWGSVAALPEVVAGKKPIGVMAICYSPSMAALYGRETDLAILEELFAEISPTSGNVAVAMAEGGSGKTTLFEAFLRRRTGTATVAWGACIDGEGAPPFWPWVVILRGLEQDDQRGILASKALNALLAGQADDATRFAVFETVARTLTSAGAPLILVLDDVQWADGGSLQLLQFLAPLVRRAPLLFLIAARPTARPEVEATLGALARHGSTRLPLRPLNPREVALLFADAGADPGQGQRMAALAGGNPFFASELARHAAAGADHDAVPRSIAEVVAGELSRLRPGVRTLATICALLDGDISADIALQAAGEGAASFRSLVAAGFLVPVGEAYRFRHDILRDTLRAALLPHERHSYDAAIAEAARAAEDTMLVAIHGCRAGDAWNAAAAHDAAIAARDRTMGMFALESAAALTDLARRVRPSVRLTAHEHLALEVIEGELYTQAGRAAQGRDVFRQAAILARRAGDADSLARIALTFGLGHEHGNAHDAEVIALLGEALTLLPPDAHALRARVLARLSWQSLDYAGIERRKEYSTEAVEEARMAADPGALATALNAHCWALALPGDLAERRTAAALAEQAARDARDVDAELGALTWRFRGELEAGEVDHARAAARRFRQIVSRSPLPYHAWYADLFDGTLALVEGDFDRAARHASAIDPAATTQEIQARVNVKTLIFETTAARERWSGDVVEEFQRFHGFINETLGLGWMLRAHLLALTRGPAVVCQELDNVLPLAVPSVAGEDWFILMATLATATILVGSPRHARALLDRLEPYAEHWIIIANGASCRGPVSSFLSGLATVAGMPAVAAAFRTQAIVALERTGARGLAFWLDSPLLHAAPAAQRGKPGLTPRENEVLALLVRGFSNQEIADALVLSVRTVQRHVENLYGRLNVHNRARFVLEAVRKGLVDPSDTPDGTG